MTEVDPVPDATPTFAVVIPALDPGAWLHRAVDSVLNQTAPSWLQAFHQSRASLHRRQLGQFLDHYARSLVLDPLAVMRETLRWATAQAGAGRGGG